VLWWNINLRKLATLGCQNLEQRVKVVQVSPLGVGLKVNNDVKR
jgi:hypothetical protein